MSSPTRRSDGFGAALVAPLALGSLLNPINSSMIATALEPTTEAGVATLPLSITSTITTLVAGRTKTLRAPLMLAAFMLLLGCGGLFLLNDGASRVGIGIVGIIFGVAQGTNSVANQAAVYEQAPANEIGTAAGLQRTAGYLGAVAASSLLACFYGRHATTAGLHSLALTMMVLSASLCAGTALDPSLHVVKNTQASN